MKLSLIKINKNGRSPDCVSKSVVLLASEYEYKPKGILPHCTSYMMNTMFTSCPETEIKLLNQGRCHFGRGYINY